MAPETSLERGYIIFASRSTVRDLNSHLLHIVNPTCEVYAHSPPEGTSLRRTIDALDLTRFGIGSRS